MEIVWEAHHNGGPMSLGVRETPTEYTVDLPTTHDAILTKVYRLPSPKLRATAPENRRLEYDPFLLGRRLISGVMLVSVRICIYLGIASNKHGISRHP